MVGREVQPRRRLRAKVARPVQTETRALERETVVRLIEHFHPRHLGVADRRRLAPRRRHHRCRHQRRRRLAVGSGDSDHGSRIARRLLVPVRELDLRHDLDAAAQRTHDDRVRLRHSGAGRELRELPHAPRASHRRVRALEQLGPDRRGELCVRG